MTAVAGADFWASARASSERHEEAPISVRDDGGAVPEVVSGTIDLVYRTDAGSPEQVGDKWRVIDYTTDADLGDTELQVRVYSEAWARLTQSTVTAEIVSARKA